MTNTHVPIKKLAKFSLSTQISISSPFVLMMSYSSSISEVEYISTTLSLHQMLDTLILFILHALTQWHFNVFGTAKTFLQIALNKCWIFYSVRRNKFNTDIWISFFGKTSILRWIRNMILASFNCSLNWSFYSATYTVHCFFAMRCGKKFHVIFHLSQISCVWRFPNKKCCLMSQKTLKY